MKTLIRITLITLAMLCGIASLPAQTVKTVPCSSLVAGTQGTVTVTASDLGGLTPLTGIVSFQPTLANGIAASYQMPNGGQSISLACTTYAVAGVFSITLPDVTLTTPPDLCFKVTAQLNGTQVLGPGYSCVQPHGTATSPTDWCQAGVCNFDNYIPVLTLPQTSFPGLPGPPDMIGMWNSMVSNNITAGGSITPVALTDAAVVTWNATNPNLNAATLPLYALAGPQTNCGAEPLQSCVPTADGLTGRTINLTGMVAGGRYMLVLNAMGEAAGAQTVTLGSGCTWQWTVGNVSMSGNSFVIPTWVNFSTLVVWSYDGKTCAGTVVD